METNFARITEIAKNYKNSKIDSLAHYINECTLKQSHAELSGNKACGIDKISKEIYDKDLDVNLEKLIERMKRQAYKPNPVKRVYIPKETKGKMRPLGIPSYEDKLVQSVLNKILNAIYEVDFLEEPYN